MWMQTASTICKLLHVHATVLEPLDILGQECLIEIEQENVRRSAKNSTLRFRTWKQLPGGSGEELAKSWELRKGHFHQEGQIGLHQFW